MLTSAEVKRQALALGFDACGIAPAVDLPELGALAGWLARGLAGEMVYLHKSAETRADIRRFLPGARAVIMTATLYNTDTATGPEPSRPSGSVRVARYARGDDYHVVLADRLATLVAWMRQQQADPFEAAIFVDKHHVQERVYARHAGLGWIGKNTCVIDPDLGSWLLLAGVATDLALAPDAPAQDQCGACTLCLDACPTGALVDPYVLDATRCIAYLTIETSGNLPEAARPAVADHLFGCDICQDVCPWNLAATPTTDPVWRAPVPRDGASAAELWQRADHALHAFVRGSAMMHTALSRLRRNLALVIGNSGRPELADVLDRPGGGVPNAAPSAAAPVVRSAVVWAKARLRE